MSIQFSEYILFSIYRHFKTFEMPAFLLKYFCSNKKTVITVKNSDDSLPTIYLFFVTIHSPSLSSSSFPREGSIPSFTANFGRFIAMNIKITVMIAKSYAP